MGILNVTPDSFSERGAYFDRKAAIARGLQIECEGADILDMGGESTRPGALPVDEEEELDRTIPVIEALRKKGLRIPISIDTYKARVAERALRAGAEIVNDISGLRLDASLARVVERYRAGIVLMHLRGTPRTMQQMPPVRDIVSAVRRGLAASLRRALQAGIRRQQIVLDPGIGFGKKSEQNFELLAKLSRFARLGYPILVGPSRKSFLRAALALSEVEGTVRERGSLRAATVSERSSVRAATARERWLAGSKGQLLFTANQGISPVPEELLFGTAAAVTAAILNGAHLVRVHDVRQMVAVVRIADSLLEIQRSA